jgi:hypothetical protein
MTSMRLSAISIRRTTVRMMSRIPNRSRLSSPVHFGSEVFQTANDEGEIALALDRFESCLVPFVQLGHALFQPGYAWFELCFVEDAFGVTIDEPSNATLQTGHLALKANDLVRCGGAIARLGNASTVFVSHPMRVFQECSYLSPYDLLQLVAADGPIVAHCFAAESVAIGTDAAIIVQGIHRIVFA